MTLEPDTRRQTHYMNWAVKKFDPLRRGGGPFPAAPRRSCPASRRLEGMAMSLVQNHGQSANAGGDADRRWLGR
jgi:hypothetical protein